MPQVGDLQALILLKTKGIKIQMIKKAKASVNLGGRVKGSPWSSEQEMEILNKIEAGERLKDIVKPLGVGRQCVLWRVQKRLRKMLTEMGLEKMEKDYPVCSKKYFHCKGIL